MRRGFLVLSLLVPVAGLTSAARADTATDWNRTALGLIAARTYNPPMASRALAMVSVAMSDAANAVDRRYSGYAYQGGAGGDADARAAVSRAACDVLTNLFPNDAAMLQTKLNASLAGITVGRASGETVGSASASTILAARAADGWNATAPAYTGGTAPGQWRPTPGAYAPGLLPKWGSVQPWTMSAGDQFRAAAPPVLSSVEYAQSLNEVKTLGAKNSAIRTAEQAAIASFWAAGAGTVTPPGMWNEIADGFIERSGAGLSESARNLALLNTTLADAAIACWDTKYATSMWRPITSIREAGTDGNDATDPDGAWESFLTTPNFPTYTSGHSTFSRAGATVLSSLYGASTPFDVASIGTVRSFASFDAAANEAGRSRIYGGIHFEFDNQAGQTLGGLIAQQSLRTANGLAPVPEPATLAVLGLGVAFLRRRRRAAR